MISISANLKQYEQAVVFQVTDESPEIATYLNRYGHYITSNGWTIVKAEVPELDVRRKIIFLRGSDFDKRRRVTRIWNLSSDSKASTIIAQVDKAIQEFVNAVYNSVFVSPRIAHNDFSAPISYGSSKNYSSNKPTITV
jgi:hypothetical protein